MNDRASRAQESSLPALASGEGRLFWAIFGALCLLKVLHASHVGDPGIDGAYYTDIAQNVAAGRGLVTDVSVFHKGYESFPHPTSVYPVWPWLYGQVVRVVPFFVAGVWVPALLYAVSLALAYRLGTRLFPGRLLPDRWPPLDAGHLLVLMIGLHRAFFVMTSKPYTDALSMVVLLAGLLRFDTLFRRPGWRSGLELGAWLGGMLLVRSQLLVVALAAAGAIAVCAAIAKPRKPWLWTGAAAAAPFVLVFWGRYVHLRGFVHDAGLSSVIRFELNRANDLLSPIHMLVGTDGAWSFLLDRAAGFGVAYWPAGPNAFASSYHLFAYAAPLAMGFGLVALGEHSSRERMGDAVRWLREHATPGWIFFGLFALGGYLSIHAFHKTHLASWNFALRQGITCVFLFFVAGLYLLRSCGWVGRALALGLVVGSVALGGYRLGAEVLEARRVGERAETRFTELVPWLLAERDRRGGSLVVAASAPWSQRIAPHAPGVGFHWVDYRTTWADLETLRSELGVEYLIVHPRGRFGRTHSATELAARYARLPSQDRFDVYATGPDSD